MQHIDDDKFETLLKLAYRRAGERQWIIEQGVLSLDDVRQIFRYYFSTFELITGERHPMISLSQITDIIVRMPLIQSTEEEYVDVSVNDYKDMIDQHFGTKYRHCDYNINHFFSGNIRWYRYAEIFH